MTSAEAGQPAPPTSLSAKVRLVIEVLTLSATVRLSLARHGLVSTLRRPSATIARAPEAALAAKLARQARRVLSVVPGDASCLLQSLVVSRLLARRGIASSLVVGVVPGPDFAAHAWVEHDGVPILPLGGERYKRLCQFSSLDARAYKNRTARAV